MLSLIFRMQEMMWFKRDAIWLGINVFQGVGGIPRDVDLLFTHVFPLGLALHPRAWFATSGRFEKALYAKEQGWHFNIFRWLVKQVCVETIWPHYNLIPLKLKYLPESESNASTVIKCRCWVPFDCMRIDVLNFQGQVGIPDNSNDTLFPKAWNSGNRKCCYLEILNERNWPKVIREV